METIAVRQVTSDNALIDSNSRKAIGRYLRVRA
jgi:hypothetical protein